MDKQLIGSVDLVRGYRVVNCGWCGATGEIMGDENHLRMQLLADRARLEVIRELFELKAAADYDTPMASAEVLAVLLGYGVCRDRAERQIIGQNNLIITKNCCKHYAYSN